MVLIFLSIFQLLLIQSDSGLIGKWEQVNPNRIGFKETMEFNDDSVTIKEEFFSKNRYEINGNDLKVIKNDPDGKKETIIESEFSVKIDSLIFSKENGKIKDKMIRISGNDKTNSLLGSWKGKTNKGVITYLSFKEDGSSFYNAVIRSEKFKYTVNSKGIILFVHNKPRIIKYYIVNNKLKIIYIDTGEEFKYQRISNNN
ncbi:MAG: hypothetical protein P8Z35_00790 [Ignavibacteriaceae bacterium]